MGGNIIIKISKGKDLQQIAEQLMSALSKAGYKNIDFNLKQAPQHDITKGNNMQALIAETTLRD